VSMPKELAEVVAKLQSMLRVGSANGWITAPVMLRDVRTLVAFADEWVEVVADRERLRGHISHLQDALRDTNGALESSRAQIEAVTQDRRAVAEELDTACGCVTELNKGLVELERENAALREPKP
jgi:chromosome segregation ATPase